MLTWVAIEKRMSRHSLKLRCLRQHNLFFLYTCDRCIAGGHVDAVGECQCHPPKLRCPATPPSFERWLCAWFISPFRSAGTYGSCAGCCWPCQRVYMCTHSIAMHAMYMCMCMYVCMYVCYMYVSQCMGYVCEWVNVCDMHAHTYVICMYVVCDTHVYAHVIWMPRHTYHVRV